MDTNQTQPTSTPQQAPQATTTQALTPDVFKQRVMAAHPEYAKANASDGTPYAQMDPLDFTTRFANKYPDAVASDGHKYSDFLPPSPQEDNSEPTSQGLLGELGQRASNIGDIRQKFQAGQINPVSGTLQIAGNLAGGINDIVGAGIGLANKGLRLIPGVGKVEDAAMSGISKGISSAASTPVGQAVVKAGKDFSESHPEATANLKAGANVLGTATMFSGLGAAKEAAANILGKDVLQSVAEDIGPELTAKAGAKAIAKGGTTKSLIRGVIKPVISDSEIADAKVVADNVPEFNKLKTFSDKVNATRNAVYDMSDKLKQDVIAGGKDQKYSIKGLTSRINAAEEPISLKGTAFEKQIKPIKAAAIKIAQNNGDTISSLLDARKGFDELVNKTYPTLWDKENAPMRNAIKAVRNAMNEHIEMNLPEGTNFRSRLLDQSKLFNAIDNMAPKAVDELGTTRIQRLVGRHPVSAGLIKKGAKVAGGGLIGGLGLEEGRKLLGGE